MPAPSRPLEPQTSIVILGRGIRDAARAFLIPEGGSEMRSHEETWFELLLGEPEIVTWLEPTEDEDDDDDGKSTAARRRRLGAGSGRGNPTSSGDL